MIRELLNFRVCVLVVGLFCTFLSGNAQEAIFEDTKDTMRYEGVVEVENTPKVVLYGRALKWIKKVYSNPDSVIEYKNMTEGVIIGNAIIGYSPSGFSGSELVAGTITYTIEIHAEDNQYRYVFTNFHHTPSGGQHNAIPFGLITNNTLYAKELPGTSEKWRNFVWNDIRGHVKERVKLIVKNLEEGMNTSNVR